MDATSWELSLPATVSDCSRDGVPSSVRIASWNIKAGREKGWPAVMRELTVLDADILLLQEVDVHTKRTGFVDQPTEIARVLGYEYAFAPTLAFGGGMYGIAILSRLPFRRAERVPLSNEHAAEPRTGLVASICIGKHEFTVANHHADYTQAAAERSTTEIANALGPLKDVIFGGDLNQMPSAPGRRKCHDAGLIDMVEGHDARPTSGHERIDYIFGDQRTQRRVRHAKVVETSASDHHSLVVDLELAGNR